MLFVQWGQNKRSYTYIIVFGKPKVNTAVVLIFIFFIAEAAPPPNAGRTKIGRESIPYG
jgi:hypothetical protein